MKTGEGGEGNEGREGQRRWAGATIRAPERPLGSQENRSGSRTSVHAGDRPLATTPRFTRRFRQPPAPLGAPLVRAASSLFPNGMSCVSRPGAAAIECPPPNLSTGQA